MAYDIPSSVTGIRLCKVLSNDRLVLCEPTLFACGAPAVDTALRRAAISGQVGPIGETGDFWADLMEDERTFVATIALDRHSWNALKRKWARTKIAA